ncbi:unnamed protein product [Staurois parvus]|uniref:Uncharacterized protein n=1 Tax=Staurois parvus TaxID=386267 RepID=A0ABN9HCJ5_9NEOB|nr:unnamed protein product [Staurois parvus]
MFTDSSLPRQLGHTALDGCAEHSHPNSVLTVCLHKTHTAHDVKQHTVNPLIGPDVNPFLPSVISTVSVLFISTDRCISVIWDVSGS